MAMCERANDSIRLDISRPVLMTHLTPRACNEPMSSASAAGIGGFSNSVNNVPSKSVEMTCIGNVIVHTNLPLFYMKSGDKKTAEHHGLQARIASWKGNMALPGTAPATDPDLEMAKPKAPPVKVNEKFPDMPWKKKKVEGS